MSDRVVVFDIGNVLIEWQPERHYDRVIGPDRRRALFDAVDLHAMNAAIDIGAPFRETVYEWADRHPDWHAEIRLWYDEWVCLAAPIIPRSVRCLRALRARGVPVACLTNFGHESYAQAQGHYVVLGEFDHEFVSGRLRIAKPDPAIYAAVEDGLGADPDAIVFADDRPENVAAAADRGWRAHLFDGPDGWADRLVAEGLLSGAETMP